MFIEGSTDAEILVVGEPPDFEAYSARSVHTQAERAFFRSVARGYGFEDEDFAYIPCAGPMGDDVVSEKDQATHLEGYAERFWDRVSRCRPRIVVCMGKQAARQVMSRAVQIGNIRGQVQTARNLDVPVLPMFGVRHCLWYPDVIDTFVSDVNLLHRLANMGYNPRGLMLDAEEVDYQWTMDLESFITKPPPFVAVDTETTGLKWTDPAVRVLTVQLTWGTGQAVAAPVHPAAVETVFPDLSTRDATRALGRVKGQLRRILADPTIRKIGHNIKFDNHQIRASLGYDVKGWAVDTQQLAFVVDDNMERKGLNEVVRRYVPAMAGYADEFEATANKADMLGELRKDPARFLHYACGDTDATYRAARELMRLAKLDPGNWNTYQRIQLPALIAFGERVERNGLRVDVDRLSELQAQVERETEEYHNRVLSAIPRTLRRRHLKAGLRLSRRDLVADALFRAPEGLGLEPIRFTKSTARKNDDEKIPSTSGKDHLIYFAHEPLVEGIMRWNKLDKMRSTYVGKEFDEDKGGPTGFWQHLVRRDANSVYIHPSFYLHRTKTGRSACVHGDQPILTRNGMKAARDIGPGDEVWTHKGRWQPVLRRFIKPVQEMWEVTFTNGEVLRCTEEHRIFTQSGEWRTLRNVSLEKAGERPGNPKYRDWSLSRIFAHRFGNSGEGGGELVHGQRDSQGCADGGGASQVEEGSVLRIKARREEPGVREARRQHEGGLPGWARLFNESGTWPTLLRAPDSVCGGGSGDPGGADAGDGSRAPYRRGSVEQPAGQFVGGDEGSTQGHTRAVSSHAVRSEIAQAAPCGSHQVYDFEVAEDHSYASAGVFHHNSSEPNAQNFPKRGDLAKAFRSIFPAPPGYKLVEVDLSQAELRLVACQAREQRMIELYQQGVDIHAATAAAVAGLDLQRVLAHKRDDTPLLDVANDWRGSGAYLQRLAPGARRTATVAQFIAQLRYQAKAVNFGFIYGMQWVKFKIYAKTDYGIDYTDEQSRAIRDTFFSQYPGLLDWHMSTEREVYANGSVRALHGAIRRLPSIYSTKRSIQQECVRQAINSPIQRFASDLGIMALHRLCRDAPDWLLPVAFIHDALVAYVREDKLDEGASAIRWYMENNPLEEWFNLTLPVPILADVSVGDRLSDMEETDHPAICPDWYNPEADDRPAGYSVAA